MFLNLLLSSTEIYAPLKRWTNKKINTLRLISTMLSVHSKNKASRKVWFLTLGPLSTDENYNNLTDRPVIPIYEGCQQVNINLRPVDVLPKQFEFIIADETGNRTEDVVQIDLLFEVN